MRLSLNPTRTHTSVLIWIGLLVVATNVVCGDNWPGWRGGSRTGVSREDGIATTWSAEDGIRWKTPMVGAGISGPIIWDNQLFLSASDGPKHSELHLLSLSVDEGREI